MKTLSLLFALMLISITANAQGMGAPNPPGHAYGLYHHFSGVTVEEVISYLERTGHEVLTTPELRNDGHTWSCMTKKEDGLTYYTDVFTDGDGIVGFEDVAL
jgi:hypothetical protein